jgi:hypothetical protein
MAQTAKGTVVHADESGNWNDLHARFEMKRVNHQEAYSDGEACTNWAELFLAGCVALRSATTVMWPARTCSASLRKWRGVKNHRCMPNGEQVSAIASLAMKRKPSVDFCGYWQRHRN